VENYTPEAKYWFSILDTVMKFPGVKIDREIFLQKAFEKYCNQETIDRILQDGTIDAGIEITLMDRIAIESIKQHTAITTSISFVAGIPGGFAMAATIPTDVLQFYYHIIVQAQKLAYIFGLKTVDEIDQNFKELITIYIGIMAGIADAENLLKNVIDNRFNFKITKMTIGKVLDKTIAHIASLIGNKLTKKGIGIIIAKMVPFISGIVSGGVTLFSFFPMCNRLRGKLYDLIESKGKKKSNTKYT